MLYTPRFADLADADRIQRLYKHVARYAGGIAREEDEITTEYVVHNLRKSMQNGVCLVIDHPDEEELVAEMHCYKLEPRVFGHVLSELTIVVHPDFQAQRLGKLLFTTLLAHIEEHRPDILRVELIARESNTKAIGFYQKLGFAIEGRLEKRIDNKTGAFEADIPMAWFNPSYT